MRFTKKLHVIATAIVPLAIPAALLLSGAPRCYASPTAAESIATQVNMQLNAATKNQLPAASRVARDKKKPQSSPISITSPRNGKTLSGESVSISVSLDRLLDDNSLKVRLNGVDISDRFERGTCTAGACTETAKLIGADGLVEGQNELVARAAIGDQRRFRDRVRFNYQFASTVLGGSQNVPQYLPAAIGMSLNAGGASPLITLTTGTPNTLDPYVDRTQYATPYPDTTFPASSVAACTTTYQVLELQRTNPMNEVRYSCYSDAGSLKTYLSGLASTAKGTEIVIAGTVPGHRVDNNLDTSDIGGTNFAASANVSAPNVYPQAYYVIGVPGADANSAYESFWTNSDAPIPWAPSATGILSRDQNNNYNFRSSKVVEYVASSNNQASGGSYVTVQGQTYTPPATNGFWLLVLDRISLQPVDSTTGSGTCVYGASTNSGCGQFFDTGSTDVWDDTPYYAGNDLAIALDKLTDRQIAFLVEVGEADGVFDPQVAGPDVVSAIEAHGGSGYTIRQILTGSHSSYVLVTHGPETDSKGNLEPVTAFSKGVVESSSLYTSQYGYLHGILARDNKSRMFSANVSQEDGNSDVNESATIRTDFGLHQIGSQYPSDWPLTDTSAHLAAYHYASSRFLANHNKSGQNTEDLRWYYSTSDGPSLATYYQDFDKSNSYYPPLPSNPSFTQADLDAVCTQLRAELGALSNADAYLGVNGIQGKMDDSANASGYASQVVQAVGTVDRDQFGSANFNSQWNVSDVTNFLAGAVSIGAAIAGPASTETAAMIGVVSGMLWTGSAMTAPGDGLVTPPSYENQFDTTLTDEMANASRYATEMTDSYDTVLDNLYSDWGKLSAVGQLTGNSGSGWIFNSNIAKENIPTYLQNSAERMIYLQLLPQVYAIDKYTDQPVATADNIGALNKISENNDKLQQWDCKVVYPSGYSGSVSYLSTSWFPGQNSIYDIFALGGNIDFNNSGAVTEAHASADLIDNLTSLGIPMNQLFAGTGFLQMRTGPQADTDQQCYKPGCSSQNNKAACVGP